MRSEGCRDACMAADHRPGPGWWIKARRRESGCTRAAPERRQCSLPIAVAFGEQLLWNCGNGVSARRVRPGGCGCRRDFGNRGRRPGTTGTPCRAAPFCLRHFVPVRGTGGEGDQLRGRKFPGGKGLSLPDGYALVVDSMPPGPRRRSDRRQFEPVGSGWRHRTQHWSAGPTGHP